MSLLILDATTKSIKINMTGAAATTNPTYTTAWADDNGTTLTEGATNGSLNGGTDVSVVAAPASSTRRVIKAITVVNIDTAPITMTVKYDVSGTPTTIAKVTLQINDFWSFDGTFDANGNLKQTVGTVNLATQVTGVLPIANGGTNASTASITSFNNITGFTAAGATGTTSTNLVFSTSPTLVTPILGTPTSGNLSNCTALPLGSVTGLGTGVATFLATPSSANLATAVTDETGSGALVFGTNPTIAKPVVNARNQTAQTYTPTAAGTATLDLSLADQHYITMPAGNITIALSNDTNNQVFLVSITQDSVGSRTVTWFTTIKWAGGVAPTLTTAANKRDTFGFIRTGSGTYDGFVIGQNI